MLYFKAIAALLIFGVIVLCIVPEGWRRSIAKRAGLFGINRELKALIGVACLHHTKQFAIASVIAFSLLVGYFSVVLSISWALTATVNSQIVEPIRTHRDVTLLLDRAESVANSLSSSKRARGFARRILVLREPLPNLVTTFLIAALLVIPLAPLFTLPARVIRTRLFPRRKLVLSESSKSWTNAILDRSKNCHANLHD